MSKGRGARNSREFEKVEGGVQGWGRAYFTPLQFAGCGVESVQQTLTYFNRRLSRQSSANFDWWSGALKSAEGTLGDSFFRAGPSSGSERLRANFPLAFKF
jgi:hypothetical protein